MVAERRWVVHRDNNPVVREVDLEEVLADMVVGMWVVRRKDMSEGRRAVDIHVVLVVRMLRRMGAVERPLVGQPAVVRLVDSLSVVVAQHTAAFRRKRSAGPDGYSKT